MSKPKCTQLASNRAGKDSGQNGCSSPPICTQLLLPGECQILSPKMGTSIPGMGEDCTGHEGKSQLLDLRSQQAQRENHLQRLPYITTIHFGLKELRLQ